MLFLATDHRQAASRAARILRIVAWMVGAVVNACAASSACRAADWFQFRGPNGDGRVANADLPLTWSVTKHVAWRAELPGRGWSSPIVVGDRVWLTAAESVALPDEARRRKIEKIPLGAEEFQVHGAVTLLALEVDARTGRLLRRIELGEITDPPPIHTTNSYASPTPVADHQRVYCHFGSYGTFAISLDSGQVVWKRTLPVDELTGPGSSPIVWHDLLIIACDGTDSQFVAALDTRTGDLAWKTPRPMIASREPNHHRAFSTPLAIQRGDSEQLVVPGAHWTCSYDPRSGAELWRVNGGEGHATVPRPVYRDGLVYVCTGYFKPKLLAIDVQGSGDVTETHVRWTYEKQIPEISSPVVIGDQLCFVSTLGIATCLDAVTGQLRWQQRLGGNFGASPIATADRIYFTNDEGLTYVVRAASQFEELARNRLPKTILASPAVHGDTLLIRTRDLLFALRSPPPPTGWFWDPAGT